MANGGRIDYTVGFKVDQSGLNQIKANLTSIQQGSTKDFIGLKGLQNADKKLIEIKKTASEVEVALNRSFNSNLGTLNISKFNQELKKLDIKRVYTDFAQLGPVGQNVFRNITSQILTTNLQLKQTNKWLDEMATTMANSVKWGITSSIWNNMTGAVEKAWNFTKKLDTSLNDIRIVTQKSADDMERYAVAANKAAKNLGQTTTQYTNASLIYYQQGLSDAEVQARTETTLKAANVTGQSAAEVSEQLTAVWNGYKVSAQEAELYVDKLSAVAASTAADLEELSTGMSKVASAANIMGVDIDQLNAQLATVVSVTRQAPESVGTAFKTIYARMGDIEAGLDTETTLGDYTKKMNEMGFNVLDTNGKLKDMGSVIEEIGNKWANLSREQQVALSQIMAGTRQYNNLLALFDNWDMYSKSIETSKNATGALQRQQDIYMESMEAHLQQLQTAGEGVYNALFNAEDVNPIIDSVTGVISLFKNFVDAIGGAQGALLLLGNIATKIFSKQIASSLATMITNFHSARTNIQQLKAEMDILSQFENTSLNDETGRTQHLIAMKREQLQLGKSLTEEERNISNEIIRQTNEIYKQQDALEQKIQEAQTNYYDETGSTVDLKTTQGQSIAKQELETSVRNYQQYRNELQQTRNELRALQEANKSTGRSQEDLTQAWEKATNNVEGLIAQIEMLTSEGRLETEQQKELTQACNNFTLALDAAGEEGLQNIRVQQELQNVMGIYNRSLNKAIQNGQRSIKTIDSMNTELESQRNAVLAAEQSWKNFKSTADLKKQMSNLVSMTQGVGQLAMAFSSINNVSSILDNESLDDGEKFLQILMTTSMVLPSLLSGLTSLNTALGFEATLFDVVGGKIDAYKAKKAANLALEQAETAAKKINNTVTQESLLDYASLLGVRELNIVSLTKEQAMEQIANEAKALNISLTDDQIVAIYAAISAKQAETAATNTATAANNAFNASLLASPWTWVALAIAAVVAGIAIYTNAVHEANKAQIEQTKTKVAAIKETQKELETNKELVKQYSELIKQYEQGELTKQDLYDKTVELVSAYGAEIDVLDILAGKYDKVREAIVGARKEELQGIIDDSNAILNEYDYSYDATLKESGVNNKIAPLWDSIIRNVLSHVPSFGNSYIQSLFGAKNGVRTENLLEDVPTVSGNTLKLDLGYAGVDQEGTFLSALKGTSAFENYNTSSNLFTGTSAEIEVNGDFSTKEGFIEVYRDIEEAYNTAMEVVGAEVYNDTEADNSLYQWLQDNKEYVEALEAEQKIIKDAQAEMKAYDINFEDTNSLYDFRKQYDELYEYIRENNPELDREGIDKQVKDLILSTSTQGEDWLVQNQAYENLVEKFGVSNEQIIADMVGSLSEEEFQALFSLNIDEISSLDQVESYIQKAKYLVEKEKITLKIETSQDAIDSLLEGKDLTDDQITSLQELEKEYEKLGVIQDRTSTAYLEKLIQIREELEQEKIQNQINIRNLAIEEAQNIGDLEITRTRSEYRGNYTAYNAVVETIIDPDKERELKNKLKEIAEQDYQVIVEVKADWQSDFNSVTTVMENMESIASKIGENFIVAAEDVEELNKAFPGILAGIEYLNDGTVQLNQEAVKAAMDASKREASADTLATVEKLENERILLESKRDAALDIAKMAESIAQGDSKVADVQGDINKALNTLKIENSSETAEAEGQNNQEVADSAAITAENMTQNFATAYEAMAADSQKFAEIAKHNFEVATTGQGDPLSPWGYTFNIQWKATKNEDIGTVATADAGDLNNYDDVSQIGNWQEVADYYYSLADSYNAASNENLGKQAELVARNNAFLTSMTNIGSGKEKDPKQIDLLDDEIDRYHDINIQLDDIAKKIERINKAQKHLVGADLIASQKQSLKLLEEEIKLRREKQKIQQAEAVELQGHLLADGVTFNEDGSVANYAKVMQRQMDVVIAAQKSGNEKAAEAAEKNYEAFKKNFERYEELRDDIEDLADEITDMMYEQISKKIETFKTKLEVKLDTAKAQKEWKEFTNQLFISANDALSQITTQSDLLKNDRSIASKATSKYDKIVNEGMKAQALVEGTAEKGTKSVYATYSKELGKYIFDQAKWQEDMEAAQQEAQETTLQIIDDVDSLGETAIGLLEDTIAAEKEQLAIYDDMNSLLNHAMKLQELFVGEEDYDSKAKMYEEQAKVASEKTEAAKERRQYALDNIDSYAEAYKEAKQKYADAVASGDGDAEVLKKQLEVTEQAYEDMKNELKESTEDFYTSIEEQIEIAKNAYINTINKAMADMENKMTGGKGLSYISDEWDLINKNADRYLDTVNSTYEVQSLEAKYRKAIDSTSSLSAQKKLNKAMEEELKALQEKDKLSQYDIDRANKKYEITMKQIALEEAQANKSSMRLRRDAQGNYSYQFVADENATAEAQQELLALQNELYNFDKERYQQTLDDALAAYQEYQQKMLEAAQINDPEKRAEMEKLITEQYQEYLLAITADNEIAKQNLQNSTMEALQGMYDVNSENFDIMTKGMFEDFKDADGNIKIDFQNLTETELSALMGDLVTGWDGSVQSMIDKIADPGPDGFKEQSKLAFETAKEAAKTLDDTLTTLGNNFSGEGNTADKILNDVKDINDKMKTFETEVLIPTIEEGQKELPDAWAAYKTGVENAATAINTLIGKLMGAYTNASNLAKKLQDIASQSPINVDINYNTTGDATTPSGNYSSGGGKTGGQPEEKEDPWIGRTITWKRKVRPFLFYMGNREKRYFSDEQIWGSDIVNAWRGGAATAEQAKKENPVSWEILADAQTINSNNKPGYQVKNTKTGITGFIEKKDIDRFDTGGYTGEWGAEGRMAMLHEKEIVLNKQDTANILNAVSIVRGIGDLINSLSANLLGSLSQKAIDSTLGMRDFEQNVHITAEFPNVSSSSEIEDALRNLTNVAAQRAFNTRI